MKIPQTIKIGGFDYKIFIGGHNQELRADTCWGKSRGALREIYIDSDLPSTQQLTNTFLHEILHSISDVYCGRGLEEEQIKGVAQGLLQVFEQLGIKFEK